MSQSDSNSFENSITVDGYIAVGKTTTLEKLRTTTRSWLPPNDLLIFKEDVSKWEDYHGHNLLKNMYENAPFNKTSWAWRLQLKVIQDILKQDFDIRELLPAYLCIQERDLESVKKVFLRTQDHNFEPIDLQLLKDLTNIGLEYNIGFNEKQRIFLYADSTTCFNRLQSRGREAEMGISSHDFSQICSAMDVLRADAHFALNTTVLTDFQVADLLSNQIRVMMR